MAGEGIGQVGHQSKLDRVDLVEQSVDDALDAWLHGREVAR